MSAATAFDVNGGVRVPTVLLAVVVGAAAVAGFVAPVAGQAHPSTVGLVAGYSSTEQIWSPEAATERVAGPIVGAYLDAATPRGWLTVLAEGAWVRRGGDVVAGGTGSVEGAVRSDYLSMSVRPKLRASAGRIDVHAAVGPAVDILVRSRFAPGLQGVLGQEGNAVFGVLLGAGVDVRVGGGRTVGLEGRVFEGLADAYSGDFVSVRNRSWEAVVRFGITLPR